MSLRHVARTVAVTGAAVLCGALFMLAIDSGVAGADLTNGFTTLTPTGDYTPGTPYGDGQTITVNVSGGTTISNASCTGGTENSNPLSASYQTCAGAPTPDGDYYFEECSDPGGTTAALPNSHAGCEAGTEDIESGDTSTGAVVSPSYTVYVLPDVPSIGGPTMTGQCGLAPNYCVVGIFTGNPNSGGTGFANPHIFSAPFQIQPNTDQGGLTAGNTGYTPDGSNPGDGTPEAPLAIGLPLAAVAVFGVVLVRNRRRRRQAA